MPVRVWGKGTGQTIALQTFVSLGLHWPLACWIQSHLPDLPPRDFRRRWLGRLQVANLQKDSINPNPNPNPNPNSNSSSLISSIVIPSRILKVFPPVQPPVLDRGIVFYVYANYACRDGIKYMPQTLINARFIKEMDPTVSIILLHYYNTISSLSF